MTEEQKEILIAKMLDAPSSLSDEELDLILNDNELRDIYQTSAVISSAFIRQPELDMNTEWNRFRPLIHRKPSRMRWVMRVAAIFIGVLLASSIVVKIINSLFTDTPQSIIAKVEQLPKANSDQTICRKTHEVDIKKEESGKTLAEIRKHSPVRKERMVNATAYKSGSAESQVVPEIDVDEYLRIQQARIDNELSLQIAESYMEKYDNLVNLLDAVGSHNPELDNMIIKVTME